MFPSAKTIQDHVNKYTIFKLIQGIIQQFYPEAGIQERPGFYPSCYHDTGIKPTPPDPRDDIQAAEDQQPLPGLYRGRYFCNQYQRKVKTGKAIFDNFLNE